MRISIGLTSERLAGFPLTTSHSRPHSSVSSGSSPTIRSISKNGSLTSFSSRKRLVAEPSRMICGSV